LKARGAVFQRVVAVLTAVVFVACLPGCKSVAVQPMPGPVKEANGAKLSAVNEVASEDFTKIVGYTTRDGRHHVIEGRATVIGDQFLVIGDSDNETYRGPVSDVVSVDVSYVNGWSVAGFLLLGILVVGVVLLVVAASSKPSPPPSHSCPFIYSWDGKHYFLDGEPFGGAVARALARTDYSQLRHLAPKAGEYRLLLANELDETQHTDSLTLLAIDHRPNDAVVLGFDGMVHAFEHRQSLLSAKDEQGTDLVPFLVDVDQMAWTPDLDRAARQLPLADTRNHLELTFARPQTSERVYLIANAATSTWGSLQIETMLAMYGTWVGAFYDAINNDPDARQQLKDWHEREELFHLAVKVRVGNKWEKRATMNASGPFISESRAIPLDLTGVEGDTIQIRVDPPIGFWSFNAFQLGWGEGPAKVQTLKAHVARDENGKDVRAQLASDDGLMLDQPETTNVTTLVFDAPRVPSGMARSVFARTRGWYEVHLHKLGSPDVAALSRVQTEPGYLVQRALSDYVAFKQLHALRGGSAAQADAPAAAER
jgi:hypothetical protein